MTTPRINEVGNSYSRLRVIALSNGGDRTRWICVCDCGSFKVADGAKLRNGHTKSCGCLRLTNRFVAHGHAAGGETKASPTYVSWASMLTRCTNPKSAGYSGYGGKGVEVCQSWKDFSQFLADMGERPTGLTLERKDNDKGYSPENCKWATKTEQARNRGMVLSVLYQNQVKSLAQWCAELKLDYAKTYHLVRTRKLSLEDAIERLKPQHQCYRLPSVA